MKSSRQVPQLEAAGLDHIEIIALLVPKVGEDRISDLTASVLKRWLAEFTTQRCQDLEIPTRRYRLISWDSDQLRGRPFDARLPYDPADGPPVLLAPLNLLRHLPWINYPDYYKTTYAPLVLPPGRNRRTIAKETVLKYNRAHFETVRQYVGGRETAAEACSPDPLFTPLRFDTLRRKAARLRSPPTGRVNGADKEFEELSFDLLSSLLYPELDLAGSQERTISGAHIRDVIFHNDDKRRSCTTCASSTMRDRSSSNSRTSPPWNRSMSTSSTDTWTARTWAATRSCSPVPHHRATCSRTSLTCIRRNASPSFVWTTPTSN